MTSLNEDKGKTISELELTLRAIKHLLRQKAKEKPDGGLVMAKGKKNEIRLSWSDMVNSVRLVEASILESQLVKSGDSVVQLCTMSMTPVPDIPRREEALVYEQTRAQGTGASRQAPES